VSVGQLRGQRSRLPAGSEDDLQPISITTLGRSGSTAIINLLSSHPQVVAYRPTETETRVASYWMDAFMSMAEPSSYLRQLFPNNLARNWWLGDFLETPRLDDDPETRDWLGVQAVDDLAAFCRGRIESFYRALAPRVGRPGATYFVEKCQPKVGSALPGLLGELYPHSREIVLVRDFRDMMSSMLTYKKGKAFAPPPGTSTEEHVEKLGKSALNLLQNWRRRADQALLVRYEDLVTEPRPTIEALLRYLDLDSSKAAVDELDQGFSKSGQELKHHRTTEGPAASIGRWRTDLEPEQLALVERCFAEALEGFGYK
jgi:hypothetical protein